MPIFKTSLRSSVSTLAFSAAAAVLSKPFSDPANYTGSKLQRAAKHALQPKFRGIHVNAVRQGHAAGVLCFFFTFRQLFISFPQSKNSYYICLPSRNKLPKIFTAERFLTLSRIFLSADSKFLLNTLACNFRLC